MQPRQLWIQRQKKVTILNYRIFSDENFRETSTMDKKIYRKCLKFYLKSMNFYTSCPTAALIPIILICHFSASNVYSFTDNQFPRTWLRNLILVTISSKQNVIFLMKPFNNLDMVQFLSILLISKFWDGLYSHLLINWFPLFPLSRRDKVPVVTVYLYHNPYNRWYTHRTSFLF